MDKKPQIIVPNYEGYHNTNPNTSKRIEKAKSYQDLSTICIVPCVGGIPPKIVQAWRGMMTPMNQKFTMIMVENMEVGAAYSETIEMILANPELSKWKYILTIEHDNAPPPDGLLKLYESMGEYDGVGGLYFTKGEGGQPMCYGRVTDFPINFIPFLPNPESVTPCKGIAMGFSLYKLEMFKDKRLPRPLFETKQAYTSSGVEAYTQDLKFCENAGKLGYKFAVDSRVRVGHYDYGSDFMW
tara:strand:- start:144 stop:866 length:723 start_codon:yes stop_codon:yes gene_type:complete